MVESLIHVTNVPLVDPGQRKYCGFTTYVTEFLHTRLLSVTCVTLNKPIRFE